MKKFIILILGLGFLLGACNIAKIKTAPFLNPTATLVRDLSIITVTPTHIIPRLTTTFDPNIQPFPFSTITPNSTAETISQKYNGESALLSPNGQWAAIVGLGSLHLVQTQGNKEIFIKCNEFSVCEFVVPLQWSPDSSTLYLAPFLTGERTVQIDLYTGIARINVNSTKMEKIIEDTISDGSYSVSLSPDGRHLALTNGFQDPPHLIVVDTETLNEIADQEIYPNWSTGNIVWSVSSEGFFFVSAISCETWVFYFDLNEKMISTIVENDPSCIELLFVNENNQLAFSKTTYYPQSKSYWYFDLATKEIIPVPTATP